MGQIYILTPLQHVPRDTQNNFCRNPDGDKNGPWCYTTDPRTKFEYCNIPSCPPLPKNCWSSDGYNGTVSTTVAHRACQKWDKNWPHEIHDQFRPAEADHNYCRNPNDDPRGPWCFTTSRLVQIDYCDIPKCSGVSQGPVILTVDVTDVPITATTASTTVTSKESCPTSIIKKYIFHSRLPVCTILTYNRVATLKFREHHGQLVVLNQK